MKTIIRCNSCSTQARSARVISAIAVALALVLSSGAQAITRIDVVNCAASDNSGAKWTFCSFNAKDSSKTFPYQSKELRIGRSAELKCKGEGKGYCKVKVGNPNDDNKCGRSKTYKLDKNKTHIFYCPEGKQRKCNKDGGQDEWKVLKNQSIDRGNVDCKKYNKNL